MAYGVGVRKSIWGHRLMNLLTYQFLECRVLSAAKISRSNEDTLLGSCALSCRDDYRSILTVKE